MFRKKHTKRNLKSIGKQNFNFDYDLEENIYFNLCAYPLKFRHKNLSSNLQFKSYHQWKQYIVEKYNKYDRIGLIEFEKYLNQLVRLEKPIKEYWNIIITALLSAWFAALVVALPSDDNIIIQMSSLFATLVSYIATLILSNNIITYLKDLLSFILCMIKLLPIVLFIAFIIMLIILITLKPFLTEKMEISFLKDYQKIIRKLIKDKK